MKCFVATVDTRAIIVIEDVLIASDATRDTADAFGTIYIYMGATNGGDTSVGAANVGGADICHRIRIEELH